MAKFMDFLAQNKNPNEDNINEDIIYGIRSESIVDYILDAYRTLESKYVKIIGHELITDESKFDTEYVNVRHIKNKNNRKYNRRMPIDVSRYDLLKIHFKIKGRPEIKKDNKENID